jgi:hypothetical protein
VLAGLGISSEDRPARLLLEEAATLGIHNSNDFYGGVVPSRFSKTKAISIN